MSRKKKWIIGIVALSLFPLTIGFVMLATIVALVGEYNNTVANGCGSTGMPATYTGPAVGSLTPMQMSRAAAVVQAGREMGIPDRGIVVALATASQESGFKVYANDGKGGDLAADQKGIAASLNLPHDAVGTDHGSLGVFQQQWPWWGSMSELMDPATSARKFYGALVQVPGWESLPVTVAAQRVQRSAYPDAYADDQPLAEQLLEVIGANSTAGGASAQPAAATGSDPYGLGPVTPQLRNLVNVLAPKFGITQVGGFRESARDPHGHPAGLAADFMVPLTPAGKKQGDELTAYAQEHAQELAIDYIIWRQRIWSVDRANEGWRPMEDRGSPTANHMDHPHINVLPSGAPGAAGAPQIVDGVYTGGTADCVMPAALGGQVVFPLPQGSGYVDQHNFGQTGGRWSTMHTGNDYSVACGTPVFAVHAGTVEFDSSHKSWAGPNFVRITTGPGQLATWYAHMETRSVEEGQQVQAGQQIGTVGTLGNSSGCHLHFEVHPRGGSIYEDPVDPVTWLAAHINGTGGTPSLPSGEGQLTVLTYNIHHGTGGLEALAQEIASSGAAVVALQEADNRGRGDFGHHVQWLATRLGMQYTYAVNGPWKGKDMIDNAILSKFPIVERGNTRLPGGPDIHPRGLLYAKINVSGQLVDVYATHLHYTGGIRLDQARAVAAEIGRASCPTVLMGDLNFTPNLPMYPVVTRDLVDAFQGQHGPKVGTVPNATPKARIDYVLHDRAATIEDAQVMPAGVSDHRAVRASLAFDPEESC